MTERAQCTAPLQYGNAVPAGGAGLRGRRQTGPAGPRARAGAPATGTREEDAGRERPQRRRGETRAEGAHAGGGGRGAESGGQGEAGGKEGGAEMEAEDR